MNSNDKYEDLLADLIAGRLPKDQQAKLESEINASPELKASLAEMTMMAMGLRAIDTVSADHIDSLLLVSYSDNPDQLDSTTKKEIERHLAQCPDCREEATLCRAVPAVIEPTRGLLSSALSWLFTPQWTFRPAVVAALCLMLILPTAFYLTRQPDGHTAIDLMLESTSRETLTQNRFEVNSQTTLVRLSFVVPSIEGRLYQMELIDSNNQVIFVKPNNSAQNLLALEIPRSYLQSGNYTLRVVELGSGDVPTDTLLFAFKLQFTDK